jgi:hypothetical protein
VIGRGASRKGPFDVNAAVLDRLDCVGYFDQLAGSGVGISKVARFDEFHELVFIDL